MLLFEIGDTRLNIEWKQQGVMFSSEFQLEDEQYGISVREDKFEGVNAFEIYFFIVKNNSPSLALTNLGKNEFKILSIVANAVSEKFKNAEIIWFSAKEDNDGASLENRKSLYGKLGGRLARKNAYFYLSGKHGNDYVFILYKSKDYEPKIHSYLGI